MKLLLVDDNPDIINIVQPFLVENNFIIKTARDSLEALNKLENGFIPDILLADIVMPGTIDGLGLARIFEKEYLQTSILLMTGWHYQDHHYEIINKPFTMSSLLERLLCL